MTEAFFKNPILNSPYEPPARHWELDKDGQPTGKILPGRRRSTHTTPVPRPKKRKGADAQAELHLAAAGIASAVEGEDEQAYDVSRIINDIRQEVEAWRALPNPKDWQVTYETARLLDYWRHHEFQSFRPFFCQLEAIETAIWLAEVAPRLGKRGRRYLDYLKRANEDANPGLFRIALKLATGAGKTTVMAMLIAWQTVNAVRRPNSERFTRGFLVVTPGITIRDRLRVLDPAYGDNYYRKRELVPPDMLEDVLKAKVVITNYHAFKRRERMKLAAGTRRLVQGRGKPPATLETEGEMLRRVAGPLMGLKHIVVLNDEAHHCYREKPQTREKVRQEEKEEAKRNREAARLWLTGLEVVQKKLGIKAVYDLSATPFFLAGSGYGEGTLFPWTVSDFSLIDAIECGIVKLPRVPVVDDVPSADIPIFRDLWKHIGKQMPKKGRRKQAAAAASDPLKLPDKLIAALDALYGHYEKVFDEWKKAGIEVPPVFIIVCNNTSTSELVYKYVSGFRREDGSFEQGRLPLFRNFDDYGNPFSRPNTILVDSEQLESDEPLNAEFRAAAADEIERFQRELIARTGDVRAAEKLDDKDILREVMNTVGQPGRLGANVRCVVSVAMLSEGWDANTVTHILGVRAFGTPLLCEQVVGRALRRLSYDADERGRFTPEYADIFGIPFDFTARPVASPPNSPRPVVQVHAVRPERDHLEIRFPRVEGYRLLLPEDRLKARFGEDSVLELTPELVGPTITRNEGLVGEGVDLAPDRLKDLRKSTLIYELTKALLFGKFREAGEPPKLHLFGRLKRIVRQWLENCLVCRGGTYPAQVLYAGLLEMACEKIMAAIELATSSGDERRVRAIVDPYNSEGTTRHVFFTTTKERRFRTTKSHVNWVIADSDWELELCRVLEAHPKVLSYVKNQGLGFEVPYVMGGVARRYLPDFVVRLADEGDEPLHLVLEVKGRREEDARYKADAMRRYWIPGVNDLKRYGRWAFAEFRAVYEMEREFAELVETLTAKSAA